jgi:uncharacterized protein involved in response to NO
MALGGTMSPGGHTGARFWHAHEMIFGYAVAVIAGFLLTAVEKWTDRPTASGNGLLGLGALWLLGRLAWFGATHVPPLVVALVDGAFLPVLAFVVGRPILAAKNTRNYGIVGMLLAFSFANLATHLEVLGLVVGWETRANHFALDMMTMMMLLIGARIIPSFTRNATRSERIKQEPTWSRAVLTLTGALTLGSLVGVPSWLLAGLALGATAAAVVSARHWGTLGTLRHPLLWILHAGYFWIVISLALRGLSAWGVLAIAPSAALHALTVGGLGALTLGMMSRVTLGHTGRMLTSSPLTTVSFVLLTLAAVCRVAVPELVPAWTLHSWMLGGTLWCLAFAAYLWRYAPMLVSPRVDGQPG